MAEIRELLLRTDYRTFSKAEIRALQAEVRELRRRDRAWAMAVVMEGSTELAERVSRKQIEIRDKHPEWLGGVPEEDDAARYVLDEEPRL